MTTIRHYLYSHPSGTSMAANLFFAQENLCRLSIMYPCVKQYLDCLDTETVRIMIREFEKFIEIPGNGSLTRQVDIGCLNNQLVIKLTQRFHAEQVARSQYIDRHVYGNALKRLQPLPVEQERIVKYSDSLKQPLNTYTSQLKPFASLACDYYKTVL